MADNRDFKVPGIVSACHLNGNHYNSVYQDLQVAIPAKHISLHMVVTYITHQASAHICGFAERATKKCTLFPIDSPNSGFPSGSSIFSKSRSIQNHLLTGRADPSTSSS